MCQSKDRYTHEGGTHHVTDAYNTFRQEVPRHLQYQELLLFISFFRIVKEQSVLSSKIYALRDVFSLTA